MWSDRFAVPLDAQLLLSQNQTACRFYDTAKNRRMDDLKLRQLPHSKLLLFDKRHLIKFDAESQVPRRMDVCCEKTQSIALIKWFDVQLQELSVLQLVMGNVETMTVGRLTRYVESEFVATTSAQRLWLANTRAMFARMDAEGGEEPECAKLVVHREHKKKVTTYGSTERDRARRVPWWGICVFQINTAHRAFRKYKFASIQEKYSLLLGTVRGERM